MRIVAQQNIYLKYLHKSVADMRENTITFLIAFGLQFVKFIRISYARTEIIIALVAYLDVML